MFRRIKELREDHDLKQKQVAAYLEIHQTTYSDYELGNLNVPVSVLIKLADYYNTTLDYITGRTDNPDPILHR